MGEKLIAIVGAGFSQSLGISGTQALTDLVRKITIPTTALKGPIASEVPLAPILWSALSSYYANANFETIAHALEFLASVRDSPIGATIPDAYKVIAPAFMDVTPRWNILAESRHLDALASQMFVAIGQRLSKDVSEVTGGRMATARSLVHAIRQSFQTTFVDLNYDHCLDLILETFEDGFSDDSGSKAESEFDYHRIRKESVEPSLFHVHGSLLFGLRRGGSRYPEIVKHRTPNAASVTRGEYVDMVAFSGDRMFIGPMISGRSKADKLFFPPYSFYWQEFVARLLETPRLLMLGYGGGDAHMNQWLLQWYRLHGSRGRCAVVTNAVPAVATDTLPALTIVALPEFVWVTAG
jgi:hypothetical protein